ncbi:30S ribosomal protein S6 [Candidatus Parcubacteria bacterium]|nr:30S ribosomal protein S6 [Candidatus Parcubacteria bacterium]
MAKNKSAEIPHYELLFIVSNKYSEDELKNVVKTAHKTITDNSGKITYSEEWGKKKFTYPIKHFHYGYYSLAEFDCLSENINKINREFRLNNEILRHMIVVKKLLSEKEIKAEKMREEKKISEKIKEEKKESKIIDKKESKKTEQKVDMKQLDEKLDKILETDDLL